MNIFKHKNLNFLKGLFTVTAVWISGAVFAQEMGPAVGKWRSYLSYKQITSIASATDEVFVGTNSGFFTYDIQGDELATYSKSNGMSDVGISQVGYDTKTGSAVIAYTNSNIDFYKKGKFQNLPDLKISQANGDKTIFQIVCQDGLAYLSSGVGLLVLNIEKNEVKETIDFLSQVHGVAIYQNNLYVTTGDGVYTIPKNHPMILNKADWQVLSQEGFRHIAVQEGKVFVGRNDSLFHIDAGNATFLHKFQSTINHLDLSQEGIWVSTNYSAGVNGAGNAYRIDANGNLLQTITAKQGIVQVHTSPLQEIWVGDSEKGLFKLINNSELISYWPNSLPYYTSYDVWAKNGEIIVAHGGVLYKLDPIFSRANLSRFKDGNWAQYEWVSEDSWVQDIIRVNKDERTGSIYGSSFGGGMIEIKTSGEIITHKQGVFNSRVGDPNVFYTYGSEFDANGNLFVVNTGTVNPIKYRNTNGEWGVLGNIPGNSGSGGVSYPSSDIVIDNSGYKWVIAPMGGGIIVYDDNRTLENISDDRHIILKKGEGSGNLPDNSTYSIAKDQNGAIWVGTLNGISIFNCGAGIFDRRCEGEMRVIQNDQFAGYLFMGQTVKSIAVDGGNRKWIGTTNGVWLLSEDGREVLANFTEQNSPLPSNDIFRINIDPVLGDVYFSTSKGLVVYRGTAVEGKSSNDDELLVYPNPVPSGYSGTVAIKGIAKNADVRITDINGQMVFRTKAHGGQAVWNGHDYTGKRVQSGVYLIFSVNNDGTETAVGKLMVHE